MGHNLGIKSRVHPKFKRRKRSFRVMPHAAFNGQTPDEMYFGNGDAVVIDLVAARARARHERIKANRVAACGMCAEGPDFAALQLHGAECRMS